MKIASCIDSVGMKGVCGDATHPYYIDSIGVSLQKTAKLADSAFITGKELFEESKKLAYEAIKSDISIDGMKMTAGGNYSNKLTETIDISTTQTYSKTIERNCELEAICVDDIVVKIIGSANVVVSIVSHDTYIFYNSNVSNKEIKVVIDSCFDSDSIDIIVSISPIFVDGSTSITIGYGDSIGFAYYARVQCSMDILICKMWNIWAMALMYKTAALILNNVIFNDRYNNIIAYQKEDIKARIAQLDSSMNLLPKEIMPSRDGGLYQQEIKKINDALVKIAKDSNCQCCYTCAGTPQVQIAIP